MNAIKITLLNFNKNAFTYFLVILEVSALFFSVNYLACVLKEQEMYIAPFRCALNENTAFVNDDNFMNNATFYNMTELQSRDELLADIKDEYKIYDVMSVSNGEYIVYSLSDEIYNGLAMPLLYGNYRNAVGTFGTAQGEHRIVFADGTSMRIETTGTFTAVTPIPEMNGTKTDLSAKDFYYASVNEKNVIITSRTAIKGYEHQFRGRTCFFIEFEENASENIAKMQSKGIQATKASLIADNSRKELADDLRGFVPIVCLITCISLIGIVFVSVITFKNNERKNAIFLLCGYSGRQIVEIHCVGILLIAALSVGTAAAVFGIMKMFAIEAVVGLMLSTTNLIVSLITIAVLILAAAIIPAIMTARKSPIEYFRRTL